MISVSRILSGLFRASRQDRLRNDFSRVRSNLLITPFCFRWFIALLAALSFTVPAAIPTAAAAESARSAMSAPSEGADILTAGFDAESADDAAENAVETFFGDSPHEADKILLVSALQWASITAVWGGFYAGVQPSDPVFSFERPPKPFVA